jgi:phage gp36-like protein
MGALATLADLRARLAQTIDDERGQRALDDASAAICTYAGQTFEVETTTERCRLRSGVARLSQRPVTAVAGARGPSGEALVLFWDGADRVYLSTAAPLAPLMAPYAPASMPQMIDVTYTHGYDVIPPVLVALTCNVAARALGSGPEQASLTGVTLDGYGETYGPVGAAGALGLFNDERALLDRYRRVGGQALLR